MACRWWNRVAFPLFGAAVPAYASGLSGTPRASSNPVFPLCGFSNPGSVGLLTQPTLPVGLRREGADRQPSSLVLKYLRQVAAPENLPMCHLLQADGAF